MAFDACMLRCVLGEFKREFPEAKIEKILQPAQDEIDLVVHHAKSSRRLVFNVGPNAPRIQLSDVAKENPLSAPMFCMFLRKRIGGARIISVEQPDFDRIARFSLSGYDDMGFSVRMSLVCEIMGKYANLILLDENDKIISALKMVDFAASSIRQILPGLKYTAPEIQQKVSPLCVDREAFFSALSKFPAERTVEKFITSTYSGVATQIAHELSFRACGKIDVPLSFVDKERLFSVVLEWQGLLCREEYYPTVALDADGVPRDYSYMDITYLENSHTYLHFSSFSKMFDMYFAERDRLEKIHQRARDIKNIISTSISRIERKLALQRETLAESERGEEHRRTGELITANLYKIKHGDSFVIATDFYTEGCPEVTIALDPRLSPAANAQRSYKLYNKAKTAREVLTVQIEKWEGELKYLDSVRIFLENAETEADITAIRDELFFSGYASRMRGYKPKKNQSIKPLTLCTTGGFTLFVGRNNIENDKLTFKCSEKNDIWFHVKDMPGSHVILVTDGREPGDRDYTEAAEIAAGYSAAKGANVAVDYTRVKNIKKPSGAKSGFVTYKTNYTAYVTPKKKID